MLKRATFGFLILLLTLWIAGCTSSTSGKKKTAITFSNVYWSEVADLDGDGYASYGKLNFETSSNKADVDVFVMVGVRYATDQDTATYYIYFKSSNFVIGSTDAKYVEIGLSNIILYNDKYDFLIQFFEADDPETVIGEANLSDFSALQAVKMETADEDALPEMSVTATTLDFGTSYTQRTFSISNIGGGVLSWNISDNQSWLSVAPTSGSTTSGSSSVITASINKSGLNPGSYSGIITITPGTGSIATINVSMTVENAGLTVTFNNPTYTDITVTVSGYGSKTAVVGGSAVYSFASNPGTIALYATTNGKTTSGTRIGELVVWDFPSLDVSAYTDKSYDLNVSSDMFFIYMTNNGGGVLDRFYVNYGLADQTLDNITIPNDNVKYRTGYYKAFANTKVVMYFEGLSSGVQWVQGTNFTLPWTVNQKAELLNTLSPTSPGLIENPDVPSSAGAIYLTPAAAAQKSQKKFRDAEALLSTN